MINTLNELISEFETFANNHAKVARFNFEFEDQIDPLIMESDEHPYMFVSPVDSSFINQALTSVTMRVKVVDIIDRQDRNNLQSILSNSLEVLQDFVSEFWEENKNIIINPPTISPLNDHTNNYTAGYYLEADFYIFKKNNCENNG